MIPCAEQCRIVLSQLCKAKENNGTKFCYAQFPFGLVDYKGLKQLQAHHESVHEKHITTEEVEWFKICRSTFSSHKPVYVSKLQALEAYFQDIVWTKTISEKGRQLRNLVGRRWATDREITAVFDILNKQHSDALYFSARPGSFMHSVQREGTFSKGKWHKVEAFVCCNQCWVFT